MTLNNFFPSISIEVLLKALTYAKTLVRISKDRFYREDGSFDGEELWELIGLNNLPILREKYGKQRIGLYRDVKLPCFEYTSRP